MATCKDCMHYDLCRSCSRIQLGWNVNTVGYVENVEEICKHFADRSQFVELPCKVGDTVYSIYKGDIEAHVVNRLEFCTVGNNSECQDYFGTAEWIDDCDENFSFIKFMKATFGKTVFLTREEAEQALKLKERES